MEFFTALVIVYGFDTNNVVFMDEEHHSIIWFETENECRASAATRSVFRSDLRECVRDTHIYCEKSETLSQSIKPRLRP